MVELQERWGALISQTCRDSGLGVRGSGAESPVPTLRLSLRVPELAEGSTQPRFLVPTAFIAALIANESGGNPFAVRFEAGVYRHLLAVAGGRSVRFGSVKAQGIEEEIQEALQAKTREFHTRYLTESLSEKIRAADPAPLRQAQGRPSTSSGWRAKSSHEQSRTAARAAVSLRNVSRDEMLRELATSWGLTQIMGYHMVGRPGTPADLAKPEVNLGVALELLAEFAEHYGLDSRLRGNDAQTVTLAKAGVYADLFRCWNTGQPYGPPRGPATCDPNYVANGLGRMALYAASAKEFLR